MLNLSPVVGNTKLAGTCKNEDPIGFQHSFHFREPAFFTSGQITTVKLLVISNTGGGCISLHIAN